MANFSFKNSTLEDLSEGKVFDSVIIIRFVLSTIYFVITAALNTFIIHVLLRIYDAESTHVGKVLYKGLAFVDISAATVYYVLEIIYAFQPIFHLKSNLCHVIHFFYVLGFNISAWLLFSIALNKLIFIKFPLRYFSLVTPRRAISLMVICGILSLNTLCDLPFKNFPLTGLIVCSVRETVKARQNASVTAKYSIYMLGFIVSPIALTIALNVALISIAVKQSRNNRRVNGLVLPHHNQIEASQREQQGDDQSSKRRRGLLNVVYLVKTALVTLVLSIILAVMTQTVQEKYYYTLACLNDISYCSWCCKMGILIISDVKLKKAAKNFLRIRF